MSLPLSISNLPPFTIPLCIEPKELGLWMKQINFWTVLIFDWLIPRAFGADPLQSVLFTGGGQFFKTKIV